MGVTEKTSILSGDERATGSEFFAGWRGRAVVSAVVSMAVVAAVACAHAGAGGVTAAARHALNQGRLGQGVGSSTTVTLSHNQKSVSALGSSISGTLSNVLGVTNDENDPKKKQARDAAKKAAVKAVEDAVAANDAAKKRETSEDAGPLGSSVSSVISNVLFPEKMAAEIAAENAGEEAMAAAGYTKPDNISQEKKPAKAKKEEEKEEEKKKEPAKSMTEAKALPVIEKAREVPVPVIPAPVSATAGEGKELDTWVLGHLPTLTTLSELVVDPKDSSRVIATYSMPRDLLSGGITDELLMRARLAKATEYKLPEGSVIPKGAFYVLHGGALLEAKILCNPRDIGVLKRTIAGVAQVDDLTWIKINCGDGTPLGDLVMKLNGDHKMYNISTIVPFSYKIMYGRYYFASGAEAHEMTQKLTEAMRSTSFLEGLTSSGMDVERLESVDEARVTADIKFGLPPGVVPQDQINRMADARPRSMDALVAGARAYTAAKARGASAVAASASADAALGKSVMMSELRARAKEKLGKAKQG